MANKKRFAVIYTAYFLEDARRGDYTQPISVTVIARDVESAMAMLKAEFPGRKLAGIHRQKDHYGPSGCDASECVLIDHRLKRTAEKMPRKLLHELELLRAAFEVKYEDSHDDTVL